MSLDHVHGSHFTFALLLDLKKKKSNVHVIVCYFAFDIEIPYDFISGCEDK